MGGSKSKPQEVKPKQLSPSEYIEIFKKREPLNGSSVEGLLCHVLMVPRDVPFDPNTFPLAETVFAFCAGPDYLEQISGKTPREALLMLGFEDSWLNEQLKSYSFPIAVFRNTVEHYPATWDTIFDIGLSVVYPGDIHVDVHQRILEHRDGLISKTFAELEVIAAQEGLTNFRSNQNDEGILRKEQFLALPNSIVNVRRLLRQDFDLLPLYSGNGFTYFEDGTRGVKEYLVKTVPVGSLPDVVLADMI